MSAAHKRRADGLLVTDAQIQNVLKGCDTKPISARTRSRKGNCGPNPPPPVSDPGSHRSDKSSLAKKVIFAEVEGTEKTQKLTGNKKDEKNGDKISKKSRRKKTDKSAVESEPIAVHSDPILTNSKTGKRGILSRKGESNRASASQSVEVASVKATQVSSIKRNAKKTVSNSTKDSASGGDFSVIKPKEITSTKRPGRKGKGPKAESVETSTTSVTLHLGRTGGSAGQHEAEDPLATVDGSVPNLKPVSSTGDRSSTAGTKTNDVTVGSKLRKNGVREKAPVKGSTRVLVPKVDCEAFDLENTEVSMDDSTIPKKKKVPTATLR